MCGTIACATLNDQIAALLCYNFSFCLGQNSEEFEKMAEELTKRTD